MDAIVAAALKKWPNVPHCYGWLALDARGDWYMRDDRIQAAGPFPRVKGSRIEHEKLREFIARNYASDDSGAWFFQNGPQRVYVELEAAPWIWRLQPDPRAAIVVTSHTGLPADAGEASSTSRAGSSSPATSASASSTRSTWASPAMRSSAAPGGRPRRRFAALVERFGYRLSPAAAKAPERAKKKPARGRLVRERRGGYFAASTM